MMMITIIIILYCYYLVVVNELFLDDFHGVGTLGRFLFNDEDLGVAAATDHPHQHEVIQTDRRTATARLRHSLHTYSPPVS